MNDNLLNPNQKLAVEMPLGPTMVIAGPGSGKTFVITQRIGYMIHSLGCNPHDILVITFTKAAAEEMKLRFMKQFTNANVQFGTFHAIFFKILRLYDKVRYDLERLISEDKKKKLIEQIYSKLPHDDYEDFVDTFLAEHTLMKNQLIQLKYYQPTGISQEIFREVAQQYDDYKTRQGLFDFDDMLTECYYLLSNEPSMLKYCQNRYKYILIDEFQDVNSVQFEIIKLLAQEHHNLFVVGDDDQSIYQFRGAKPEFLLSFKEYFSPVNEVILDVNYRSTKSILEYSNKLIKHNKNRYVKAMRTDNQIGDKPRLLGCEDSKEQAHHIAQSIHTLRKEGTPLSECAIIYRTNIQARPLIEVLLATHIPFVLRDSVATLYDQWITKDILAYLYLAKNLNLNDFSRQIINRPSRYISKVAIEKASKVEGNFFNNVIRLDELSPWQKDYIQKLVFELQQLKQKPLLEGIRYIRKQIGYDKYIEEYAAYRKIPVTTLMDVLSEIEDSASNYSVVEDWEDVLKFLSASLKNNKKMEKAKHQPLDAVVLTTMHSAKGLEFKEVFIIDVVDGVIPHNKCQGDLQLEEERRLFYVALTRAKQHLSLYIPKTRYQEKVALSPFIEEILMADSHLKQGDIVIHTKYGKGEVLAIHESQARIRFLAETIRVIDYKYCIKNGLLKKKEG